jgi:hypothetical protein
MRVNGSTFSTDDMLNAEITSSTNLATVTTNFNSAVYCGVQVVTIDDATVQLKSGSYGTGATADLTVTTIDPAKTFWFFSYSASAGFTFDSLPYLWYVNSTTLRLTRVKSSSGVSFTYRAYVVSLSGGVAVQNVSTVIASGNASVSPTITSVTVANTAVLLNGTYQRFASVNSTNDDAGGAMMSITGLTTTAFTANRAESPAVAATINAQVLSWVKTSTAILLIQD